MIIKKRNAKRKKRRSAVKECNTARVSLALVFRFALVVWS